MDEDILRKAQDPSLTSSALWELLGVNETRFESKVSDFVVVLESFGVHKIPVIKEVRLLTGMGLKDAKNFVESCPNEFGTPLSFSQATDWVSSLSSVGGTAKIKDLSWNHDEFLCVVLAHHKNLSTGLVSYLLMSNSKKVESALARNPHLPKESLSACARVSPANFLQNPLLPLLLLEDPMLPLLDSNALCQLIQQQGALPMLYPAALAREGPSVALLDTFLPNLPTDILAALAHHSSYIVQGRLASHCETPSWVLEILGETEDSYILSDIAIHPNLPEHLLEKLSYSKEDYVVASVARNSNAPVHMLRRLATHSSKEVLLGLASNPSTPEDILLGLAAENSEDILYELSHNPDLPRSLLERLIDLSNVTMTQNMVNNYEATPAFLERLFSLVDKNSKLSILQKTQCSVALKMKAQQDDSSEVRALATKLLT